MKYQHSQHPIPPFLPCFRSDYNFCSCFSLKRHRRSDIHESQLPDDPSYHPWLQGTSNSSAAYREVPWDHSGRGERQGVQVVASDPAEEAGACERHEDYRKTRRRKKSANKHSPHHHNCVSDRIVTRGKGGGRLIWDMGRQYLYKGRER